MLSATIVVDFVASAPSGDTIVVDDVTGGTVVDDVTGGVVIDDA